MARRMVKPNANLSSLDLPEKQLFVKEESIKRGILETRYRDEALWKARFEHAKLWLEVKHKEKTKGKSLEMLFVSLDDTYSLAEFEDYGRRGDAVLLAQEEFGQVWSLERESIYKEHIFALTKGPGCPISCELRYTG